MSGLLQLEKLYLDDCRGLSGTVLLYGHNQSRISFALRLRIGSLEPISGLLQLKSLGLYGCQKLTGTVLL